MYFRYYLTVTFVNEHWTVGLTPEPDLDRMGLETYPHPALAVGIHPYPLGPALQLVHYLEKNIHKMDQLSLRELQRLGRRAADKVPDYPVPEWRWMEPLSGELPYLSDEAWRVLSGKMLTGLEVGTALNSIQRITPNELERQLHGEVLTGRVQRFSGIGRDELGRAVCQRCGEKEQLSQVECAYCGGRCFLCHACNALGPIRECIPMYQFSSQALQSDPPPFELTMYPLSPVQSSASQRLVDFYSDHARQAFLVWAVCGAGKTELVFETVRQAILHKERVLYAVPRREVVLEIGKRMEYAFPGVPISILVGGEGRKIDPEALVTVATTHQVLRFSHHFPLVILDEADAYPYEGSRMLRFGLERALSPNGQLIYLTATPTRELRQRYDKGELEGIRIPGRHHGHPLPVPELWSGKIPAPLGKFNSKGMPSRLLDFLLFAKQQNVPVMLFLPTVVLVDQYGPFLEQNGQIHDFKVGWVHASHPQRDKTVEAFRQGKIHVLLTTTVMERGLNFPGVQVLVLHAERDDIFDVESLVQIAGRAGRYPSHPTGKVVFWGERITRAMLEAREWILAMNLQAEQDGLLIASGGEK